MRTAVPLLLCALLAVAPRAARAEDAPAPAPPPPRVREWQTGALAPDKLQHASLSLTLGLGAGLASRRPAAAAGGTLALGVLKELRDRHVGRGFDPADLAADAVGAALAALIAHRLDR